MDSADRALRNAVRDLDEYELRRLIIYAQGLLREYDGPEFEPIAEPSDKAQPGADQSAPTVTYRQEHVRCGKENCSTCPHGPYWYAYWRDGEKMRSKYVGKHLPGEPKTDGEVARS